MKILVADDDAVMMVLLKNFLDRWGFQAVTCRDGAEVWDILQGEDPPGLILLDRMMPKMDGLTICQRLRELPNGAFFYIILLTQRDSREEIMDGLAAGANDYVIKPFNKEELRARINAGRRVVELQSRLVRAMSELETRNQELTEALATVNQLSGLLPICASCKKIRDDKGDWRHIETFIRDRSEADFSHSICPDCAEKLYPELAEDGGLS